MNLLLDSKGSSDNDPSDQPPFRLISSEEWCVMCDASCSSGVPKGIFWQWTSWQFSSDSKSYHKDEDEIISSNLLFLWALRKQIARKVQWIARLVSFPWILNFETVPLNLNIYNNLTWTWTFITTKLELELLQQFNFYNNLSWIWMHEQLTLIHQVWYLVSQRRSSE